MAITMAKKLTSGSRHAVGQALNGLVQRHAQRLILDDALEFAFHGILRFRCDDFQAVASGRPALMPRTMTSMASGNSR